jgi:hypothetical protein
VVPILISLIKDCSDLDAWSLSFCRHKKKKLILFAGRTIKKWPPTIFFRIHACEWAIPWIYTLYIY